jgi:hypothetical protein
MPSALANRFVHIDFETDFEDWAAWAVIADIHPLVHAFLRLRRDLLLDTRLMDRGFPTPRSWEMASDAVKIFGDASKVLDVLIGIVGEGAAMEFIGFCSQSLTEERVNAILSDPDRAALPTDLGGLYALVAYVAARAKEDWIISAAGQLLVRLNPELAVILARQVLLVRPNFSANAGFVRFIEKHRALLSD